MEFDKHNVESYFQEIKKENGFPASFVNELFLIGKITADTDLKNEILGLLENTVPKDVLKVLKSRGKLNISDYQKVISSLLTYAKQSPNLPVGELYTLLGHKCIQFYKADVIKKLNANPDLLGRFDGVKELRIGYNVFSTNKIPASIGEITSLEDLEINGSYEDLPQEIGKLSNLKVLEIRLGYLREVPKSILKLKQLEELRISGGGSSLCKEYNEVMQLPDWLDKLTSVKSLDIYYFHAKEIPEKFPPNLESLAIGRMPYMEQLPESIGQLQNLKSFNVHVCTSLKSLPESLSHSETIEELQLGTLPKLEQLDGNLVFSPHMRKLVIRDDVKITEPDKRVVPKERLRVFSRDYLKYLFENPDLFPNLTDLEISSVKDCSLEIGAGSIKTLKKLEISNASNITGLLDDVEECKRLEFLLLNNFDIEALPSGVSEISKLKRIKIQSCPKLQLQSDDFSNLNDLEIYGAGCFDLSSVPLQLNRFVISGTNVNGLANIGLWEDIEELVVSFRGGALCDGAEVIESLPDSFTELKQLKKFSFSGKLIKLSLDLENAEYVHVAGGNNFSLSSEKLAPIKALGQVNIPKVKVLQLDSCHGVDLGGVLSNTPMLEILKLNYLSNAGGLPKVDLPALKELEIHFSDVNSVSEMNSPNLEKFDVLCCDSFDDSLMQAVCGWRNLKSLTLSGRSNIQNIPEEFASLPLEVLGLSEMNLSDIPACIGEIKSLHTLYLEGFSSAVLPLSIASLTNLERLSIESTRFEEKIADEFKNLKLKELKLFRSKFAGNNMKQELYENLITTGYTREVRKFSE